MFNRGYVEFKFSERGKFNKYGDLVSTCVIVEDSETREILAIYESDSSNEEKVVSEIIALVKKHNVHTLVVSHRHFANISVFNRRKYLKELTAMFRDCTTIVNYETDIPLKFLDIMRLEELAYVLGLDVSNYTGATALETASLIRGITNVSEASVDETKLEKVLRYKDSEVAYKHLKCTLETIDNSNGAYTKDQLLEMVNGISEFPAFIDYIKNSEVSEECSDEGVDRVSAF